MKAETTGDGEISGRGKEAGGVAQKKKQKKNTRLAYAR